MQKYFLSLIFIIVLTGISFQAIAGETPSKYFAIKGGLYSPSRPGNSDYYNGSVNADSNCKTEFNRELAIGWYLFSSFAVEFGVGHFESKTPPAREPGSPELGVIPVTAAGKVFLPLGPFEPYGEFGIGAYFTRFDSTGDFGRFSGDTKVTYGTFTGAGINFNITDTTFLSFQGRYLWARPSYGGRYFRINGSSSTIALGVRF
jgi:hypothetical protein